MESKHGSRVVLFVLGGVALVVMLVLGGFFLTGGAGNKLDCVRGDETVNPRSADGIVLPVTRQFATIEEGEAFICHRVAYPRELQGWRLQGVSAHRSQNLGDVIEGKGFASVEMSFTDDRPATDLRFEVSPFSLGTATGGGREESIRVQGQPATLQRGGPSPDFALARWKKGGLDFMAIAILGEGFSQSDFLAILESVR